MMGQMGLQVFQPPHLHSTVLHVDQMLRKIHHSKGFLELWEATKTDQEYRGTESTKEWMLQTNSGHRGTLETKEQTESTE